jgi:hypothetical protein
MSQSLLNISRIPFLFGSREIAIAPVARTAVVAVLPDRGPRCLHREEPDDGARVSIRPRVDFGYGRWSVETLPVCFAHKCSHTCVASTNSRVDVFKDRVPFFHGDASQ